MAAINYADKRVLITEDQAEMRAQLKSMLERMGVARIDTAPSGEEGIEALKIRKYDIVFCDYELGRGKDGQQVLEEARHSKLLEEVSSFILVTAAQTVEMVMGALEYHPDGYITKPVTFDDLRSRMERILKTKLIYKNVNMAIDQGEQEAALEACNKLVTERPKLAMQIYRLKGRLLLELGRADEAELMYETVLGIRNVAWATLGMAKVSFHQKKYEDAVKLLNKLGEANQRYVESYDWLAKIQEAKGDTIAAQKTLEKAIDQSPKAMIRQNELARIAMLNEDWEIVAQAARRAVSLGKNSCYKKPENYTNLVTALQPQLLSGGIRERRYVSTEIFKTLDSLRNDFADDQPLQVEAYILESATQNKLGRTEDARHAANNAVKVLETIENNVDEKLIISVGRALAEVSDLKTTLEFIETKQCDDSLSATSKKELIEHAKKAEEERIQFQIDKFNNKGVEFFEKGILGEAIQVFEKAADYSSASYSVLLNTLQAHIALMQKKGTDSRSRESCKRYFDRLSHMPENDRRYVRYKKLKTMYQEILKNS